MNETEHLKSMWAAKIKRKLNLIVPKVTYDESEGSLHNDSWAFKVPYAFRDALDIKFEERIKDKEPYMVWTQGPILNFKEGDMLHSKDGVRAVQILSAAPMGWDSKEAKMNEGAVFYSEYAVAKNSFLKLRDRNCTQMQFLQMLIHGTYDDLNNKNGDGITR